MNRVPPISAVLYSFVLRQVLQLLFLFQRLCCCCAVMEMRNNTTGSCNDMVYVLKLETVICSELEHVCKARLRVPLYNSVLASTMLLALSCTHTVIFLLSPHWSIAVESVFARFSAVCCSSMAFVCRTAL